VKEFYRVLKPGTGSIQWGDSRSRRLRGGTCPSDLSFYKVYSPLFVLLIAVARDGVQKVVRAPHLCGQGFR
jgi:hypothetical protein